MAGLTRLVEEWTENLDDYRWDLDRFIDVGERVVILARHGGKTKDEGVTIDQPVGAVYWVEEGAIIRMDYFLTWREALEAAGLRESLEPS
jgi:hypothetical protein